VTADVEGVRGAERDLAAAIAAQDVAALDRLLHDDLVYTDPAGATGGKQDDLDAHRTRVFTIATYSVRELAIDLIRDGVAVTRVLADMTGEPLSGAVRYTRVWANEGGRWQVRVAHVGVAGTA